MLALHRVHPYDRIIASRGLLTRRYQRHRNQSEHRFARDVDEFVLYSRHSNRQPIRIPDELVCTIHVRQVSKILKTLVLALAICAYS